MANNPYYHQRSDPLIRPVPPRPGEPFQDPGHTIDTFAAPGVAFHYRHIRQREDTDMQARTLLQRTAMVIAVAVVPTAIAGAAQAAGGHVATECATVKVRATPQLNTAMVPETITSKVTSCATASETVKL